MAYYCSNVQFYRDGCAGQLPKPDPFLHSNPDCRPLICVPSIGFIPETQADRERTHRCGAADWSPYQTEPPRLRAQAGRIVPAQTKWNYLEGLAGVPGVAG